MSYFQEIGVFERPFLPLTVNIHGQDVALRVRSLSAKEQDEIEAFNMDEYARVLTKLTTSENGEQSERGRVEAIYATKSQRELVDQLMPTRQNEIMSLALDICHIDPRKEVQITEELPEDQREAYMTEQNDRLEAARIEAESQIRERLMAQSVEELAHTMAQVNVNLKALTSAGVAANAAAVYYVLYQPEKDARVFDSVDQVREELSSTKIKEIALAAQKAIASDLPFVSQGDDEPSKQLSSTSTSEADTEAGGTPTTTTPDDSKPSSTPA